MDELPFPKTLGPLPTADGGRWSAEFDSFNMRHDDAYYLVTREDVEGAQWCFFVRACVLGLGTYEEKLTRTVAHFADKGTGNAPSYSGNPLPRYLARAAERRLHRPEEG